MIQRIRAHHGMCFFSFQGKGYSGEFIDNMWKMKEKLDKNPEVILLRETDDVCAHCPNNRMGKCVSLEQVADYDGQVLALCGLSVGVRIRWKEFESLVWKNILDAGRRKEICGECEWNELCNLPVQVYRKSF